jgi:hypothetical protein
MYSDVGRQTFRRPKLYFSSIEPLRRRSQGVNNNAQAQQVCKQEMPVCRDYNIAYSAISVAGAMTNR